MKVNLKCTYGKQSPKDNPVELPEKVALDLIERKSATPFKGKQVADEQISKLQEASKAKDEQILKLQEASKAKDEQISKLQEASKAKDEQILKLKAMCIATAKLAVGKKPDGFDELVGESNDT